jgi:hypothetical protein
MRKRRRPATNAGVLIRARDLWEPDQRWYLPS